MKNPSHNKSINQQNSHVTQRIANATNKLRRAAGEFSDFMMQTRTAMILAIGVVTGNAVSTFVSAIVNGLITPALELILPKGSYENLVFSVRGSKFLVGEFLSATINMFIILAIVYVFAKYITRNAAILEGAVPKTAKVKPPTEKTKK